MAKNVTIHLLLGSETFYPGAPKGNITALANLIGRKNILDFCCFFLSYFSKEDIPEIPDLLATWFSTKDVNFRNSPTFNALTARLSTISRQHPEWQLSLLNIESLLRMFLWTIQNEVPDEGDGNVGGVMTRLFNMYLCFNDQILSDFDKAVLSVDDIEGNTALARMLASAFSQNDFINADYAVLLYTQFYKLIKFLEFMVSDANLTDLHEKLLSDFNCKNNEEFVKAIGGAVVIPMRTQEPGWIELEAENDGESIDVLKRLSLNDEAVITEGDDYLPLRNTPFYIERNNSHRVIYDLFLVKKLYNGLIFKLAEYLRVQPDLLQSLNFFGYVRDHFSESVLVYEILAKVFSSLKQPVLITGQDFKNIGIEQEPDFYCREGNKILLFESKDFYMTGAEKLSYDFNVIVAGLRRDGRLGKACKQLARNAYRGLEKQLSDTDYDATEITIYPVIIVHDALYSAPSLNYWVDTWFQEEIEKEQQINGQENLPRENIKPLTIIEIDSLIFFAKHFEDGTLNLAEIISIYIESVKLREADFDFLTKVMPFTEIFRGYCFETGIDINTTEINELLKKYAITD